MAAQSCVKKSQPKVNFIKAVSDEFKINEKKELQKIDEILGETYLKLQDLESKGILAKAASIKVLAEEAPGAYKDIDQVVQVSHELGIVEKVVRLVPIGVVKG